MKGFLRAFLLLVLATVMCFLLIACKDEETTTTTETKPPVSGLSPEEQGYINRLDAAAEEYIDNCESRRIDPQPYIVTVDDSTGYTFFTQISKNNGYTYTNTIISDISGYDYISIKNNGTIDNIVPESGRSSAYYEINNVFNDVYYSSDGYAISRHGDFTTCIHKEDKGVYIYFTKVGQTVGLQTVRWIYSFDELSSDALTERGFPSSLHHADYGDEDFDFRDFHCLGGESITSECTSRYTCTDCGAEYTSSEKVHSRTTVTVRELDDQRAKAELSVCSICKEAVLMLSDSDNDTVTVTYTPVTSDRVTKYGLGEADNKVMIDDMTYSGNGGEFDRLLDIPDISSHTGKILVGIRERAYSTISENVAFRVAYPEGILFMESGAIGFNASYIELPDSLTYMADRAIGSRATVKELTLPIGITYFGEHNLPKLTSLTVNCLEMTEMRIPVMESYDDIVFNCQSIEKLCYHSEYTGKSIIIPKGVRQVLGLTNLSAIERIDIREESIGWSTNMLTGCVNVKEIILPESVSSLPALAFKDLSSLETLKLVRGDGEILGNDGEILIPTGVSEIPICAFQGCTSVKRVILHTGITKIGYDAFYGCTELEYIRLNENITEIGGRAFMNCSKLGNECFGVGDALLSIGERAFYGTAITEFTVPSSVTSVEYRAFAGTELDSLIIKGEITNGGSLIDGINIREITFERPFRFYGVYGTAGTETVNIRFTSADNSVGRVIDVSVSTVNFAGTESQFEALGFDVQNENAVINYGVSFE